jgi:uncharacterized protein YjbI with pentapeptide repeats
MGAKFRVWWQKIVRPSVIGIIAVSVLLVVLIVVEVRFNGTGFAGKTLWDWLNLIGVLAVPVVVGFGAVWFTTRQGKVADAENKDNQREAALQAYINQMSELLLEKKLRESDPNAEVRKVARVRTLSMLYQLNTRRINYMLAFLRESELITNDTNTSIVSLRKVDLRQVDLHDVDLHGLDLSETNFRKANLSGAYINKANLSGASFSNANLSGTNFRKSNLSKAFLSDANLSGTVFSETNLSGATLTGANFNNTFFGGANLSGANFSLAKFTGAELKAKLGKVDLSKTYLEKATIDKASLDEIFVTKQQIETMNIIDSQKTLFVLSSSFVHPWVYLLGCVLLVTRPAHGGKQLFRFHGSCTLSMIMLLSNVFSELGSPYSSRMKHTCLNA